MDGLLLAFADTPLNQPQPLSSQPSSHANTLRRDAIGFGSLRVRIATHRSTAHRVSQAVVPRPTSRVTKSARCAALRRGKVGAPPLIFLAGTFARPALFPEVPGPGYLNLGGNDGWYCLSCWIDRYRAGDPLIPRPALSAVDQPHRPSAASDWSAAAQSDAHGRALLRRFWDFGDGTRPEYFAFQVARKSRRATTCY